MKILLRIAAAQMLFLAASLSGAVVPAGTILDIRLTSEVSSDKPSGQPAEGVMIAPAVVNGTPIIPAGTRVIGTTADANAAQPAANGSTEKAATYTAGVYEADRPAGP